MVRVAPWLVAAVLVSAPARSQPGTIQAAPGPAPQAPPRDSSVRTGTARIRGHVFASDTGAPLRRVQVRVSAAEIRENRVTVTDAQGAYEIKGLPAGRYTLSASKGTYVSLQYGQTRPFEPGKPLQILDGQTLEKVDFSLPRGSVITGRILDEFGEPTSDVAVAPMRFQYVQGRRRLTPSGRPATTNDIGEFRLFGLAPGQYYLSATLRAAGGVIVDASSDDRSGYAPTYYPGTPNPAEAQRIDVPLGGIVSDVTIALVQTRTARISGSAVDASGKPLAGGFLMVMQRNGPMIMSNGGGQIRPDGSFTVSGLAPGDYTLQAQVPGAMPGETGESVAANITVSGEDITGLQLAATKPVTATGRLVVDPETAKSMNPSTLRILAAPANPDDMPFMSGGGGRVNDDLTFEIRTRPGTHMLRLQGGPAPGTSWLRAVRYNGVDVADTGIEFRPGQDVGGIEIELTNHPSEVTGLATTARGEPSKDYTVIAFALDPQRRGFMSRYFGIGRPDQDGRFRVRNLPPGSYYAIALDHVDTGEASDPEFLDRIQDRATRFALNDGEAKTLDLKVQPAP